MRSGSAATDVPEPTADHDPLRWLLEASHTLDPGDLGPAVARALQAHGAEEVVLFVVDHNQLRLNPVTPTGGGDGALDIAGTPAGRAFSRERTQVETSAGGEVHVWAPLIDGTARLGVLRVDLAGPADDVALRAVDQVAGLTAELLVAKSQYTDIFELSRRDRPMTLAAELQRSSLPPVALVTERVAVAGMLQPAYEVAGDSFDYALNHDGLHVAILDSVGHDLDSSLVSHLVQGCLRNSRRRGLGLVDAYAEADEALAQRFPDLRFATAAFGCLDLDSGMFRWISAGHPAPLVLRQGAVVGPAPVTPSVPIGLGRGVPAIVNEVHLDPGDGLVLYTDGVVEGGVRGFERFGLERFTDVLGSVLDAGLPPAEVLRRLTHAVLEHSTYELRDDVGIMLVQRRG
jgi:serine phosphatase RsbU (regulator of sigma subunit)